MNQKVLNHTDPRPTGPEAFLDERTKQILMRRSAVTRP